MHRYETTAAAPLVVVEMLLVLAIPLGILLLPVMVLLRRRSKEISRLAWSGDPHGDGIQEFADANPFPLSVDPNPSQTEVRSVCMIGAALSRLSRTKVAAYQRAAASD